MYFHKSNCIWMLLINVIKPLCHNRVFPSRHETWKSTLQWTRLHQDCWLWFSSWDLLWATVYWLRLHEMVGRYRNQSFQLIDIYWFHTLTRQWCELQLQLVQHAWHVSCSSTAIWTAAYTPCTILAKIGFFSLNRVLNENEFHIKMNFIYNIVLEVLNYSHPYYCNRNIQLFTSIIFYYRSIRLFTSIILCNEYVL